MLLGTKGKRKGENADGTENVINGCIGSRRKGNVQGRNTMCFVRNQLSKRNLQSFAGSLKLLVVLLRAMCEPSILFAY